MPIKSRIRTVPHYPKQGVMFRDITTLLKDPVGFRVTITELANRYAGVKIDRVAGIEARGFIVGAALAYHLGVGFVPIRKKGKLPAETVGQDYELEYGTDILEMHQDAIEKGDTSKAALMPYDTQWRESKMGKTIERNYHIKEYMINLTDAKLNAIIQTATSINLKEFSTLQLVKELIKRDPKLIFELAILKDLIK